MQNIISFLFQCTLSILTPFAMFQQEIVYAALTLLVLYPSVNAHSNNGRVFKALNDQFTIFADLAPCTGQTMCLCYRTDDQIQYLRTDTPVISVLCHRQTEAFICAKHKVTAPTNENTTGTHELIVATSAMKEAVKLNGDLMVASGFTVSVNIADKNTRIGKSQNFAVSSFANLHYKSLDQRVVKFFLSSCWSNVNIAVNNLEEVKEEFNTENSSIWEVVTSYLYDTGNKALDVAQSTLAILAGVLHVDLTSPKANLTTTPSPTEDWLNTTTEVYNTTYATTDNWTTVETNYTTEADNNETTVSTTVSVKL